jgi:hypothetical protein
VETSPANAIYEPRYSASDPSRFPGFATDLVDRKVNVIFAGNHAAGKAAQIATATVPIVALADDMEEAGLVARQSHRRRGGARDLVNHKPVPEQREERTMRRKAAKRELIEPHKADRRYIRRDARPHQRQ